MHPVALVVLAFVVYRAARVVTRDTISLPFRQRLFLLAWTPQPNDPDTDLPVEPVQRGREWRRWTYDLFTCPLCMGIWLTVPVYVLWLDLFGYPWNWERAFLSCAAIAGVQCFLQVGWSE